MLLHFSTREYRTRDGGRRLMFCRVLIGPLPSPSCRCGTLCDNGYGVDFHLCIGTEGYIYRSHKLPQSTTTFRTHLFALEQVLSATSFLLGGGSTRLLEQYTSTAAYVRARVITVVPSASCSLWPRRFVKKKKRVYVRRPFCFVCCP